MTAQGADGRRRLAGKVAGILRRGRGEAGETLVESLVAILIATLVFTFLANAIAVAARVSSAIRNADVAVDAAAATQDGKVDVTVDDGHTQVSGEAVRYSIPDKEGGDLYEYYEYAPGE